MLKILKNRKAFTLLEMLISITILMIFVGILAGSYGSLIDANRSANELQKTYRNVRFVFETVATEVQEGRFDYTCFDAFILSTSIDPICSGSFIQNTFFGVLKNGGLERTAFKVEENKLFIMRQKRINEVTWDSAAWEPLLPENFPLDEASFEVIPKVDPYETRNADNDIAQVQPRVTLKLKVKGQTFETSYSSRSYGKKSLYQ